MSESPDEPIVDAEVVDDHTAVAVPSSMVPEAPVTDYTDDGTPTFDYVRDRIEGRFATSLGATELAENGTPAASLDEQLAAREQAGRDRLEEIRRAMREK